MAGRQAWYQGRTMCLGAGRMSWEQAPDVLGTGRMSGEIPLTMPGENVMMRKTSIFRQTRW